MWLVANYGLRSNGWRVNNVLTAISLGGNLGLSENNGMISFVTDLKNMDIQEWQLFGHLAAVMLFFGRGWVCLLFKCSPFLSPHLIKKILVSSHFILHSNVVSILWFWTPALTFSKRIDQWGLIIIVLIACRVLTFNLKP